MNPDEIEAALEAAFNRCNIAGCPLSAQQKQILLQVAVGLTSLPRSLDAKPALDITNPLDDLTFEQRQQFLRFVKDQEEQNLPWKTQLLNDWLLKRDSGAVQFIRDRYGPQWLNQLQPVHFEKYAEGREALKLKVGDRIEVSNGLWEWVQETGPCSREWFASTVIWVNETNSTANSNCIIRLNNGAEYEMQGVYEWNRYNWRWPQ